MNRRIRKKKQKLEAMHASKYKYTKLGKKRAHAVYIQTRNCLWGLIPHENNYAMYLRRKRRYGKLEDKIRQQSLQRYCQRFKNVVSEIIGDSKETNT